MLDIQSRLSIPEAPDMPEADTRLARFESVLLALAGLITIGVTTALWVLVALV
ncbi:MAG: hypothetical protein HXY30_10420 [Pseudorhodoplanes sp.]|nr:hypothetical protein [Pseudorhodoplanes sp.]